MYINKYIVFLLYVIICLYNYVDIVQTKMLLDVGAFEANPLLQYLINVTGTWKIIIYYKAFWLTGLGVFLLIYGKGKEVNSYDRQKTT